VSLSSFLKRYSLGKTEPGACGPGQYLWGVASGMPVVHQAWLEKCIREDRRVDLEEYRLPAGYSLLQQQFIIPARSQAEVFSGLCVLLVCVKEEVAEQWKAILQAAGAYAEILQHMHQRPAWLTERRVDYIICDQSWAMPGSHAPMPESPMRFLQKALEQVRDVRSCEWAAQSLVEGELLDPDHDPSLTVDWDLDFRTRSITDHRKLVFSVRGTSNERYEVRGAVALPDHLTYLLLTKLGDQVGDHVYVMGEQSPKKSRQQVSSRSG
jgi:hypothetical protein